MNSQFAILFALLMPVLAAAQSNIGINSDTTPKTIIGERNPDLSEGARRLMAGDAEKGVKLTLKGLNVAVGEREHEAALSNLCAGYILLGDYATALTYCDMLLERNDRNWRAYNNRAVIYIKMKQYDKAERDLERGEALRPGAHTLKVARAMYMDAVAPVTPEIAVDDRPNQANNEKLP